MIDAEGYRVYNTHTGYNGAIEKRVARNVYEKARAVIKPLQKHGRIIGIVSGMVLILAGLLVWTDRMKYVGAG